MRRERSDATVVVGLGFGDEGKGATVDRVVAETGAKAVVRWNGGPQASHHVVREDGSWHAFSQFGSGTFSGAATHLSRGVLVEPMNLLQEAEVLKKKGVQDPMAMVTIDPRCLVVTPAHKLLGQVREIARGPARHGSVGMGVGDAVADAEAAGDAALRVGDLTDRRLLREKLAALVARKLADAEAAASTPEARERVAWFKSSGRLDPGALCDLYGDFAGMHGRSFVRDEDRLPALLKGGHVVLEGAQGVLLDPVHGFSPHVTKTRCTPEAGLAALGLPRWRVRVVGVLRAFAHRHGQGPLPSEEESLRARLLEGEHNAENLWQGRFRVGWFDFVLGRLGLDAAGRVDEVALTCLDRLAGLKEVRVAGNWSHVGPVPRDLVWGRLEREGPDEGPVLVRGVKASLAYPPTPELAAFVSECRPRDVAVMRGWSEPRTATYDRLPRAARDYVEFLASNAGLAARVASVAVGPRRGDALGIPE